MNNNLLAEEFNQKFKKTKNYKERTLLNIEYFIKETQNLNNDAFGFQKKFLNFFDKLNNKKILLYGASRAEIDSFCQTNAEVYDLSYPKNESTLSKSLEFTHDFEKIKIDCEYFDFVFSSHVVEHISKRDINIHFQEIKRVLKKGGKYIFICPSFFNIIKSNFTYKSYHVGRYSYNDILELSNKYDFKMKIPLINPLLLNFWITKNKLNNFENIYKYFPSFLNSLLGTNSLYICLESI